MKKILTLLLLVLIIPNGIFAQEPQTESNNGGGHVYPETYFYDWEICQNDLSNINKDRICRQVVNTNIWWQTKDQLHQHFYLAETTVYTNDLVVLITDSNQDGQLVLSIDEIILLFPEAKNNQLTGRFVQVDFDFLEGMNDVTFIMVLSSSFSGVVRDVLVHEDDVTQFLIHIVIINSTGIPVYAQY